MAPPDPTSETTSANGDTPAAPGEAPQQKPSGTEADDPRAPHQDAPPAAAGDQDEGTPVQPEPRRHAMTALEVRILVKELQPLVGGYLDKAYQPSRDEVLLRFRAPGVGRRDLYFRRGGILLITERPPRNPTKPPGFAMALRKHASGGRVFKIEQTGFDRIVTVWVQRKEGDVRIVFEFLGDGNCMLVRPDGRILVPLVPEAWAGRTIRGGAEYKPPPARDDPTTWDADTFCARLAAGNKDIVRALALEAGLGGAVAEEVCMRAGVSKTTQADAATADELSSLWEAWRALADAVDAGETKAGLLVRGDIPIDFTGYESHVARAETRADPALSLRPMASISAAADALYLAGRAAADEAEAVAEVDTKLGKLERQRAAQEAAVIKFDKMIGDKAQEGELLFAHYQAVERIRTGLLAARRDNDWKQIQATVKEGKAQGNADALLIDAIDPNQGRVTLALPDSEGNTHKVTIDITKSVTDNAQAAYDRSKSARQKLAGAKEALAGTRTRMDAAAEARKSASAAVSDAMRQETHLVGNNRHWWFEAFRWFWSSNGYLVVAGRDAGSNDRVVKKHLQDGDRYVHADLHGAPSVVVKGHKDDAPDETTLREAAQAAITFSRAFGRAGSGDAYWVTPPQVSKTPQAGEFLARGAFIVRGERNYLRKLPLAASIGIVWLDAEGRPAAPPEDPKNPGPLRAKIMGGPPESVHAHAQQWLDLQAGQEPRAAMVKTLAKAFSAHPDAIERALPVGELAVSGHKGVPWPPRDDDDGGPGATR